MSNDKTTPTGSPVYTVGETPEDVAPTQNWVQRKVVTPIKKHKTLALAAGAGVALVVVSTIAGRKSAQYDVVLELQPADDLPEEAITVIDTSSSDE